MPAPVSVSIVIPSFNQGPYIGSTLRSVLGQSDLPEEVVVMDGGSTDETLEICRRFEQEHGGRLRVISEPDRGQSDAINKAVALTTGALIGWLNSDDTYAPGAISFAREFFTGHPTVDLLYGNADFVDPADRRIAACAHVEPFDAHRLVHVCDFIVQPAAFFTRRAFDAVGGVDDSLHYAMDYDLFLKIASRFEVVYRPVLLANYKWFGQNKSATGAWERLEEIRRVAERGGGHGLPVYARLEAALQGAVSASGLLRKGQLVGGAWMLGRGMMPVVRSPRAWAALLTPGVWRIIWTGQVLRRGARPVAPPLKAL